MREDKFNEIFKKIMANFYIMDRCTETLQNIDEIVKLGEGDILNGKKK